MAKMREPPPYTEQASKSPHHHSPVHSLRGSSNMSASAFFENDGSGGESIYSIVKRPDPQHVGPENAITIPLRRSQRVEPSSNSPYHQRPWPSSANPQQTLDGAHDYSWESRITSTTWTTVSRVGHRIFTDSSSSSREDARARYNREYNELATKHGLPQLKFAAHDTTGDKPSSKPDTKQRRQGWFARKLLPRKSTTFTYKARTSHRPIPRKKSFSRGSSGSEDSRRNILEGKTLEETCKLGGLGVLLLPNGYAVDPPTLPSCLSATATYIMHHGLNAPGIFRISGQASIVNALYDYFAHQFGQAGSPTKVQTTVQPGQLPLHIEYTLHDVATFFKKVLGGLPGGLLGYLETFDAIKEILLNLEADPTLTIDEMTMLRAKLIALNLLSISSLPRINLIQAALGLFAYLGDKAEAVRREPKVDTSQRGERQPASEIMGYQALGVCLGPLLVGDLTEVGSQNSNDSSPRASTESNDKPKKKRDLCLQNKLDNPERLKAAIDRANLAANIMQLLLMTWRDVVKQLRFVAAQDKAADRAISRQRSRSNSRKPSRHSVRVTDEELRILDMMRGSRSPVMQPYHTVVKQKLKAKSRSSMPRIAIWPSRKSHSSWEWFHGDPGQTGSIVGDQHGSNPGPRAVLNGRFRADSGLAKTGANEGDGNSQRHTMAREDRRVTDEDMSSRQILDPLNHSREVSISATTRPTSPCSPTITPRRQTASHRATSSTPEASVRRRIDSEGLGRSSHRRAVTLDKTTVMFKKGLPPPPVEPPPKRNETFPPRHSSLEERSPVTSSTAPYIWKGNRARGPIENQRNPDFAPLDDGSSGLLTENPQSVKARSFSSTAKSGHGQVVKDSAPKLEIPVIPPFENAHTGPAFALDDPFVAKSNSSSPRTRDTLIPKPVADLGRRREVYKRSPSPPKLRSIFNLSGKDAITAGKTDKRTSIRSSSDRTTDGFGTSSYDTVPTRPLSTWTLESLRRREAEFSDTPLASRLHFDNHSRDVSRSSALSAVPSDNLNSPSDTLFTSGSRNATNSTLFAEITRLKRQLEHKDKVLHQTRRSLEAARMAKEEGPSPTGSTTPTRGSWNKGTLSKELRLSKKELDLYKQRAEWLEKRLIGVEGRGRSQEGWLERSSEEVQIGDPNTGGVWT